MGVKVSLAGLLLFSVLLFFARGGRVAHATDPSHVELTFWTGFTGPDGPVMMDVVTDFHQANPDIDVTMQRIPWGTYYNKLMVAAVNGRGPEVFISWASYLTRLNRAGFVDSADDLIGPGAIAPDQFTDFLRDKVNFGTADKPHYVAVPLDTFPQGMYCNKEMLVAGGFVNADGSPKPPTNRDEFLAVCRALKTKKDGVQQWGFSLDYWIYNYQSLIPQFGGQYVDKNGQPTLDCPGNVAALQCMVDLVDQELVPDPKGSGAVNGWTGFRQKLVALDWNGPYMLGDLKTLAGHPYMGAPMPQLGPFPGTLADSHTMCIRKGLDAPTRAAAAKLVRYISDHSIRWADAGQVPARKDARESDAFKQMPVQYAFSKQMPYMMYPPRSPSVAKLNDVMTVAVESAVRRTMTPATALGEANRQYKEFLEHDREEQDLFNNSHAKGEAAAGDQR